jgi:hypothetical protein
LKALRAASSFALSAAMARSIIAFPSAGDAGWGSAEDAAVQATTNPAHAATKVLVFTARPFTCLKKTTVPQTQTQ